jgi:hypothetical protein
MRLNFFSNTIDLNKIRRTADGSIMLRGVPFRSGKYQFMNYEIGLDGLELDEVVFGNISETEMMKTKMQFKGLPVTLNHIWIDSHQTRSEFGAGVVMSDAEEFQETEGGEKTLIVDLLITEPKSVAIIESGNMRQLSIGFQNSIVEVDFAEFGYHFEMVDLAMNHLAIVEYGRAGKEARLLNKGVMMDDLKKELETMKVQFEELKLRNEALAGENGALKASIDVKKSADDVFEAAKKMAFEHAELGEKLSKIGVKMTHSIGDYDKSEVIEAALSEVGVDFEAGKGEVYLSAFVDALVATRKTIKVENADSVNPEASAYEFQPIKI